MSINEKKQMKKYILVNKIFIALQIILVVLSVIFNFVSDDATVFITIFIHVGVFVLHNVVIESIVEYGYLRKKYAKICDEIHRLRYFKLKKRMYKASKIEKDIVSSTLILQSVVKSIIVVLSIISLLFMVSFE